jgi:hypothetical protein
MATMYVSIFSSILDDIQSTEGVTALAYEVDLQEYENYVRVHVKGERRYGDAAVESGQVGRQIVAYCRDANVYRVMIVLELRGRLSAFDSLEMVSESEQYGWDHSFRLAFVETNASSFQDVKFTETIATNRAYSCKAFNDEAEAVAWLIDGAA